MSQAFILCPTTKEFVYVGLNLEWLNIDTIELVEQTLSCPLCGQDHVWNQEDLTLRADGAGA